MTARPSCIAVSDFSDASFDGSTEGFGEPHRRVTADAGSGCGGDWGMRRRLRRRLSTLLRSAEAR